MLKILEAQRVAPVAGRNSPQLHWPNIHPGTYAEWREWPGQWSRVWVNNVMHEHDGEKVYTIVMVELLDGMGMRTVNGEAIATCIRELPEAQRDVAQVAGRNSPQPKLHWPDIHPGTYVEWREWPGQWSRVWVNNVMHEYEHDGEKVYTIVMVALLDGQRKLGMRTVNREAIATCIRELP
jgi:hypothetical protein